MLNDFSYKDIEESYTIMNYKMGTNYFNHQPLLKYISLELIEMLRRS